MIESIKVDYHHACLIDSGLSVAGSFGRVRMFYRVFFYSYGLQLMVSYRFCRWTSSCRGSAAVVARYLLRPVALLFHNLLECMYDIHISPSADIAPGLYVGHFGGIRIGPCTIGNWCNVNQQVIIGQDDYVGQENSQISIGDRVWIGAHSKVKPGVTIGNGTTISVGTVVSKDIPDSALVGGASCRVVNKNYDNSLLLGSPEQ